MSMALAPISAMAASKIIQILKVTVDYGRLREGPSSAYDVVGKLAKGERVFYLNENVDAFCKICTTSGKVGYIYRGFLQAYGAARSDQIYYAATNAKVYKSPNGKSLGTMAKGTHFMIYQIRDGWGLAKNLHGNTGYVRMSDVTRAAN